MLFRIFFQPLFGKYSHRIFISMQR
jgi:hypothetical protein